MEETGTKPLENTTTTQEPAPINDPPKTDETPKSNNSDKEIKTTEPSSSTKSFSVEELNGFHDKGNQKLKELEDYIKQISTKSTPNEIADQSTENAIKLFDSEDRMVEISSINSTVKTKKKIRKYLTSLRLLPYENIEIEWAEFLYTSDFIKGPDGNYHGYITFRQRFSATIGDKIPYTDITTKRTEIILKFYNKAVEGVQTENWDVFIGDISVEKTEKN